MPHWQNNTSGQAMNLNE